MTSKHLVNLDIRQLRKTYALYILRNRAIPAITDGLKPSGRRPLWMARNGKVSKVAALAGATMVIHPHDECSDAISGLAGPYKNNICLFKGDGSFGTLLEPSEYGAPRYTSVSLSKFTEDAILVDLDIIPMMSNYDNTMDEPVHFLPLVPMAIINPSFGMVLGFRSLILPRNPQHVITAQIEFLSKGTIKQRLLPHFVPTSNVCDYTETDETGIRYFFQGKVEIVDSSTALITQLPYGLHHTDLIRHLETLLDAKTIVDYVDESRNIISIYVKFKRGDLKDLQQGDLLELFGLVTSHTETLNVLTLDGQRVQTLSAAQLIEQFTTWRLSWYRKRYQRLIDKINTQIDKQNDIVLAIDNKINEKASTIASKQELVVVLQTIGVKDPQTIADMSIHRFTPDEATKAKALLENMKAQLDEYTRIINDDNAIKQVYIAELKEIQSKLKSGQYST